MSESAISNIHSQSQYSPEESLGKCHKKRKTNIKRKTKREVRRGDMTIPQQQQISGANMKFYLT